VHQRVYQSSEKYKAYQRAYYLRKKLKEEQK